ncbi:hypothetical protein BHM03_00029414 [Ensete ventricosum]|nr:hypothetical protein BHM03_00029414 [Ensete ventricosum]
MRLHHIELLYAFLLRFRSERSEEGQSAMAKPLAGVGSHDQTPVWAVGCKGRLGCPRPGPPAGAASGAYRRGSHSWVGRPGEAARGSPHGQGFHMNKYKADVLHPGRHEAAVEGLGILVLGHRNPIEGEVAVADVGADAEGAAVAGDLKVGAGGGPVLVLAKVGGQVANPADDFDGVVGGGRGLGVGAGEVKPVLGVVRSGSGLGVVVSDKRERFVETAWEEPSECDGGMVALSGKEERRRGTERFNGFLFEMDGMGG